jgi:hypothetical protein
MLGKAHDSKQPTGEQIHWLFAFVLRDGRRWRPGIARGLLFHDRGVIMEELEVFDGTCDGCGEAIFEVKTDLDDIPVYQVARPFARDRRTGKWFCERCLKQQIRKK